jgi:formylglycine-generating enzyme required for sulfatase activity
VHGSLDTSGTVEVPAGPFAIGSSMQERSEAIETLARHGGDPRDAVIRLRREQPQALARTEAFLVMALPVTQSEYARYVYDAGVPEPWVDDATWSRTRTRASASEIDRFAWENGRPQPRRAEHPAVLVSQSEAEAYCAWWGERRGGRGRLPSEAEWEKAARGDDGRAYPWGQRFDPGLANTRESGRGDTEPVGGKPGSASPYGALDMAGNVLEWTATKAADERVIVKGGGWAGDAIAARCASRSSRPRSLRDVTIGFRCVLEPR